MKTGTSGMSSAASRPYYVFALMLILVFGPSRVSADTINTYVFTANAAANLGGDIEMISGSFTYDSTDSEESGVSITLTGIGIESGNYTEPSMVILNQDLIIAYAAGSELGIMFANPLTGSPDPLAEVEWSVQPTPAPGPVVFNDPAPVGAAVFATPEPSSIILLVTVVAMAGSLARRKLAVGGLSDRPPNPTARRD